MTLLESFILGVLEGLTEFLPVSSTGHLILATALLSIPDTPFVSTFLIAVQLGAISAVIVSYWRTLLNVEVLKRLFVGFLPTGIMGVTLYRVIKDYLLGSEHIVVLTLFLGGIALVIFELTYKEQDGGQENITQLRYRDVFLVGIFQSIAMIPGVSRSAATIVGGLLLGLRRTTIVEFSFLLAVPTMLAATGYDALNSLDTFTSENATLLGVGFVTSFGVALLAMRFLLAFVKRQNFIPFGIYRIVIAVLFFSTVLS